MQANRYQATPCSYRVCTAAKFCGARSAAKGMQKVNWNLELNRLPVNHLRHQIQRWTTPRHAAGNEPASNAQRSALRFVAIGRKH
jgi:hypothetical protein